MILGEMRAKGIISLLRRYDTFALIRSQTGYISTKNLEEYLKLRI